VTRLSSSWLCVVTTFLCVAGPATAQVTAPRSGPTVASCEDKQTMVAVGQALGLNLLMNRTDAWLVRSRDSRVNFETWSRNLEYGWQWDETQFTVNMFTHPYQGSLYVEAARANCLNYWESIPIAFLGAWTWEFFGEIWLPSLNDFWMSGLGGVAIGEILHRVSTVILDEESDGSERIWREIGALLVNPVGGLNRLVRGQWTRQGVNPADRLPESYLFRAKVGGRRVREYGSPAGPTSSPTLLLDIAYGDLFETEPRAPFDVISLLAQVSPDGGGINILRAVGRLYGKELTDRNNWQQHQLVVSQRFDYVSNPVYHFGEQTLEIGLQSRWRTGPGGLHLRTHLAGDVVMLGAIDALDAGLGQRTIDFGPGVGVIFEVALERAGTTYVSLYNRARYLRSVSGAPANHNIFFSGLDLTIPITSQLGIGAYVSGDRRRSYYEDLPKDHRSYLETRVYATWTFARGRPGSSR